MAELYKNFKHECKEKALFVETYYQSYGNKDRTIEMQDSHMLQFMQSLAKQYGLCNTGGIDNHHNLFQR